MDFNKCKKVINTISKNCKEQLKNLTNGKTLLNFGCLSAVTVLTFNSFTVNNVFDANIDKNIDTPKVTTAYGFDNVSNQTMDKFINSYISKINNENDLQNFQKTVNNLKADSASPQEFKAKLFAKTFTSELKQRAFTDKSFKNFDNFYKTSDLNNFIFTGQSEQFQNSQVIKVQQVNYQKIYNNYIQPTNQQIKNNISFKPF